MIGADLNGHVGKGNDSFKHIHGGHGYGTQNAEGRKVLETAEELDLFIANTGFAKREEHKITFKSGNNQSQIDYLLVRRNKRKEVLDCKVIPGEAVVQQHRICVMDLKIKRKKKKLTRGLGKIQTWKLRDNEIRHKYITTVLERKEEYNQSQSGEESWMAMKNTLVEEAIKVCGRKPNKKPSQRETWWWSDEVQKAIKAKKKAFKEMRTAQSPDLIDRYKNLKREAKRAVAHAKAEECKKWYKELETTEGQKRIFKIAKVRERAKRDTGDVNTIKDKNGKILSNEREIKERWKEYFEELLNTENERDAIEAIDKVEGPEKNISMEDVKTAIRKMKIGKATGTSEVDTEMIKALEGAGIEWLTDILNKIWREEKIPDDWQNSILVPIYKQKGDTMDCSNYRGIKLLEHGMKVYERVIDKKLRERIDINEMQFGFMPGKGTTDAIFIMRQRQEKALEGNKKAVLLFCRP